MTINKLVLFLLISGFSTFGQTLKEKQAIAGLDFSWAEKRIFENYGSKVTIELDKPTFAGDIDAILYTDQRGAVTAANAMAKICDDALGKEALQGMKITKVLLKNDKSNSPKITIDKGVMTLWIAFTSSDKYFSESELKDAIENML
jgi:hypothetical protein